MRFALSITILLARGGAEIGPHLLDGTDTPTLHRDIAQNQVSIEDLLAPFAGKKPGLAFRVHADNDAKAAGGVADAVVASLRETGLPADPAEAAAVLTKSPVPLSITLQYEYLDDVAWPVGVKNLAEAFGETNGRAEVEGGLLLHAYLSTAGAAALLDRLQRQRRRRRVCLGGRLYVVVHELGRGSAPRTQRRPQLWR